MKRNYTPRRQDPLVSQYNRTIRVLDIAVGELGELAALAIAVDPATTIAIGKLARAVMNVRSSVEELSKAVKK